MKNKNNENKGYNLVKERVTRQLLEKHSEEKSKWKHINGRIFKISKFFYWLCSILTLFTVALNVIIIYFAAASNYKSGFHDLSSFFKNNIYIVAALFLCYVLSMVFQRIKKPVVSSVITFVGTIFLVIQYFQLVQPGNGYDKLMYYYIPAWIVFIASLIILIIILSDKKEFNVALNKEITRIYNHFSESDEDILMTQDDWDNLLVKYEQQELYKEKNIKKAKKALENAEIEETETETE